MVKFFPNSRISQDQGEPRGLPEVQGRQKLTVELTAGSGGVDLWHASMHVRSGASGSRDGSSR